MYALLRPVWTLTAKGVLLTVIARGLVFELMSIISTCSTFSSFLCSLGIGFDFSFLGNNTIVIPIANNNINIPIKIFDFYLISFSYKLLFI